ncbi:hypothetical protein MPB2EB_1021 [Mycoavidus sp. B2-EB]|nr:hypothetical protein MPB2EB_1021 [Mycoavidus sp. B2-EB]
MSVAWKAISGGNYLLTGDGNNLVCQWQVIKEGNEYYTRLCWRSMHTKLTATDTLIEDVKGLSEGDCRLLKQRGAIIRSREMAE